MFQEGIYDVKTKLQFTSVNKPVFPQLLSYVSHIQVVYVQLRCKYVAQFCIEIVLPLWHGVWLNWRMKIATVKAPVKDDDCCIVGLTCNKIKILLHVLQQLHINILIECRRIYPLSNEILQNSLNIKVSSLMHFLNRRRHQFLFNTLDYLTMLQFFHQREEHNNLILI